MRIPLDTRRISTTLSRVSPEGPGLRCVFRVGFHNRHGAPGVIREGWDRFGLLLRPRVPLLCCLLFGLLMEWRDFLNLPAVREQMMRARRRALLAGAIVLAAVFLFTGQASLGLLAVTTGLGAALGWRAQPSATHLEGLLIYDLFTALMAWYLLEPAAAVAFLVVLVVMVGSMLLPPQAALRLVGLALAAEALRVPIHLTDGLGFPLYAGGGELATVDFAFGIGVRAVVIVWGAGLVRTITAMIAEAARTTEASERRFRAAFADAPIGMGLVDSSGRVVRLNAAFALLSGVQGYRIGETSFVELLSPPDQEVATHSIRWAAANPGRRVDIECETNSPDPDRRLISLSVLGIDPGIGGEGNLVLVQARDITEQREAERRVSHRLEIEGVIRSVSTYLVETPVEQTEAAVRRSLKILGGYLGGDRAYVARRRADTGGLAISYCWCRFGLDNEMSTELCSSHREELGPTDWLMERLALGQPLVVPNVAEAVAETERRFMIARGLGSFLAVPVRLSRDEIGFLAVESGRSHPEWTDDHSGLAWVVAELLSHGLRRQVDRDTLEDLLRSKGEFVARVSHELRTPMTVVLGLAEELVTAGRVKDREEAEELLELIASQSRELSLIVEDLLVAARMDIGSLTIRPAQVELAREVRLAWTGATPGIEIELDVPEAVAAFADPLRVRQIIRNLLTNAARYGGRHVRVEARREPDAVVLVVADDGPGVPEADVERIFQPYVQATSTPGMPAAMGLGLAVARNLARLMGGDVTYTRVGGWTRFETRLPVGPNS